MRRAASLNADQTSRQGLEERQHLRPLQLPPQYCLASGIDAVQLEDPLGDVQTDCGNLPGGRLPQLVALNGPSLAHRCRQGTSTASGFDHQIVTYRSLGYEIIVTDAVGSLAGFPPETLADRKRDRDWART
jgi:hypothetical protein